MKEWVKEAVMVCCLEERTMEIVMGAPFSKSLVVHPYTVVFCAQQWSLCTIAYCPHILLS
jgi:hypothetical protein